MALSKKDVEFFLNQARVKLVGATDANIKQQLFAVIKEFLRDSNSWLENVRLFVTAGTQQYTVTPRNGGQIIRLLHTLDGNQCPVPASMPEIPVLCVFRPIDVTSDASVDPSDLTLGTNKPWYVSVVKNISLPQTQDLMPIAPEFLLQRYEETILDGVVGKMMMESAKPYTNPQLGTYHLRRFRDGIGIARDEARTQNLFGGQRWRFPQQFMSSSQRGGSVATLPQETF